MIQEYVKFLTSFWASVFTTDNGSEMTQPDQITLEEFSKWQYNNRRIAMKKIRCYAAPGCG
jgi:hypothetical protein